MAEFKDVMKQKKRMCENYNLCKNCTIFDIIEEERSSNKKIVFCDDWIEDNIEKAEHIIMKWAEEHPERYPTWYEWQEENFPDRGRAITHCQFDIDIIKTCKNKSCDKCIHSEIPEHIAKKLGLEKR